YGVAGDYHGFDVLPYQKLRVFAGEAHDGAGRFGAVRHARRVAEIDEVLMRKHAVDLPHHRQAADARIKNADGQIRVRVHRFQRLASQHAVDVTWRIRGALE